MFVAVKPWLQVPASQISCVAMEKWQGHPVVAGL